MRKEPIFEYLESIAEFIPASFYWLDLNGRFINLNNRTVTAVGAKTKEEVIGKTVYELYQDQEVAKKLQQDIDKVIKTEQPSLTEDRILDVTTRKFRYFSATRGPLRGKTGQLIGIMGVSIEITAEKEAEQLKIESEANKINLIAQEKFKVAVGQMLHDMQSPLSSLSTIVAEQSGALPENTRVTLRNATDRIGDIANNMLNQYENKAITENESVDLLASLALLQVMSEKRHEYYDTRVVFETEITPSASFAFIKINPTDFKRMISNVINNAVDAVKNKADGKVVIQLVANSKNVVVVIHDNGYGMPPHIVEKFHAGVAVTEGKEHGRGIGLTQVHDTINTYGGKCSIFVDIGTEIIIKFPVIPAPHWIASEIKLGIDDTVLILDDDKSIHGAWKSKFESLLKQYPNLQIKHYTHGKKVISYINSLNHEQKSNTFLLTDFELYKQGMNGVDVVKKTGMHRAILVTSHAASSKIQQLVTESGIKTLPKELTSAVTIKVDKKIPKWSRAVDMVWIEDQKEFVDDMVREFYSDLKVDVYYDPNSFLEDIHQYPLTTRFILDTHYDAPDKTRYLMDGFTLAKQLHEMGYTKLILFAGQAIPAKQNLDYLTVVLKGDLVKRKKLNKL